MFISDDINQYDELSKVLFRVGDHFLHDNSNIPLQNDSAIYSCLKAIAAIFHEAFMKVFNNNNM